MGRGRGLLRIDRFAVNFHRGEGQADSLRQQQEIDRGIAANALAQTAVGMGRFPPGIDEPVANGVIIDPLADRVVVSAAGIGREVLFVAGPGDPAGRVGDGDERDAVRLQPEIGDPLQQAALVGIRADAESVLVADDVEPLVKRRLVEIALDKGERSFARATRFRRLAKDDERLPETVVGLHFVAFACLVLHRAIPLLGASP